jgi:ATPase involved in DNA repair
LEFSPNGITAIIGENGSGKSSIIEAIQFAFFGDSDKGNLRNLVKWGRRQAKVELEFETKDGLYKVIREINKTGKNVNTNSEIYIYENGRFRLHYQKDVNKELQNITRLTKKHFLHRSQ